MFEFLARNETFRDSLFETLLNNGCVYSERHGIQVPDWFDLETTQLSPQEYYQMDKTYDWPEDSRLWKAVKSECKACHERAVIFNLSSMGKFLLKGKNSVQVVDSLTPTDVKSMANKTTTPTYLLNSRGGIDSDVILHKVTDEEWYITCADLNTNRVLAKIQNSITDQLLTNTQIFDLSQEMAVLSLNGPKSTAVLEKCLNISLKNFEDRTHTEMHFNVCEELLI